MARNDTNKRVPVPLSELEEQFEENIRHLKRSCRDFDNGDRSEFRRMAHTMRLLLYDKSNAPSLIRQIGLSQTKFVSHSFKFKGDNLLPDMPLAVMSIENAVWNPILTSKNEHWLSFDDWWDEPVYLEPNRKPLLRKDFVLITANQNGGSHSGTHIDKVYRELAKENSTKFWAVDGPDGKPNILIEYAVRGNRADIPIPIEGRPMLDLEKAYVRHIASETLTSLEAAWTYKLGNRPCPCGSDRKRRYCCGKVPKHGG